MTLLSSTTQQSSTFTTTTTTQIPFVQPPTVQTLISSSTTTTPTPEVTIEQDMVKVQNGVSWDDPFPDWDDQMKKFDEGFETDTTDSNNIIPEFIQPISPHKLDDDDKGNHHEYYKHISIVGGIIFGALLGVFLTGGLATYCWRRNIGIARANSSDTDGRTLSGEGNDDFMWVDTRDSREHTRMSRL
jgi:hypothetical protein